MKISKTALLVLGIGIFVIAFAAIFTLSSGQSGEQEKLNESLAAAQNLLPKLIAEKEDLATQLAQWEGELAEATSSLDKSEARFPKSVESIEYDEILFRIADDCGLQVMELTASEPEDEGVKDTDITYAVTTLEVVVQNEELPPSTAGDFELYIDETVDKVLEFINVIATGEEFNVGTVDLVSLENLEPPNSEEVEEARKKPPEATVKLIIYAFPR